MRNRLAALLWVALAGAAWAEGGQAMDWKLATVDGEPVGYSATLNRDTPGWLRGRAPCNTFSARLTEEPGGPLVDGIRSTKMACDALSDEVAFFDLLSQAMTLEQLEGRLVVTGPAGVLTFDPAPAAE